MGQQSKAGLQPWIGDVLYLPKPPIHLRAYISPPPRHVTKIDATLSAEPTAPGLPRRVADARSGIGRRVRNGRSGTPAAAAPSLFGFRSESARRSSERFLPARYPMAHAPPFPRLFYGLTRSPAIHKRRARAPRLQKDVSPDVAADRAGRGAEPGDGRRRSNHARVRQQYHQQKRACA
eukprot:356604-Chlamydomonas_euryale.AAC.3